MCPVKMDLEMPTMRRVSLIASRLGVALTACLLAFCAPTTARAEFVLSGWSGFHDGDAGTSGTQAAGAADGTINFAVYKSTDGNWTNDFGFGFGSNIVATSGSVDASAQFVYAYQIVNNDLSGTEGSLDRFLLSVHGTSVTSFGYVKCKTFNDSDSPLLPVGPSTNAYLGAGPGGGPTSDPAADGAVTLGAASFLGSATTPFANHDNAIDLTSSALALTGHPEFGTGEVIDFGWSSAILPGQFSTILFVTSNSAPTFKTSELVSDGVSTFNELPVPTPLPASLALLLSSAPVIGCFALAWRRRARRNLQQA
jgi:hypothetical protein